MRSQQPLQVLQHNFYCTVITLRGSIPLDGADQTHHDVLCQQPFILQQEETTAPAIFNSINDVGKSRNGTHDGTMLSDKAYHQKLKCPWQ